MTSFVTRRAVLASTAALAVTAGLAPAGLTFAADTEAARAFVQVIADEIIAILNDTSLDVRGRQARFEDVFRKGADVDAIGRFVAGSAWRPADEGSRTAYLETFASYIAFTYAKRIGSYSGENLKVGRIIDAGTKGVIVKSSINRPGGQAPVAVDWRLKEKASDLKVIDLIIENVSMSITQRDEFSSLLVGYGGNLGRLTEELKARVAKG